MADYRFYCLGGDGRIGLADWIVADSDVEPTCREGRGKIPGRGSAEEHCENQRKTLSRCEGSICEVRHAWRQVSSCHIGGDFSSPAPLVLKLVGSTDSRQEWVESCHLADVAPRVLLARRHRPHHCSLNLALGVERDRNDDRAICK